MYIGAATEPDLGLEEGDFPTEWSFAVGRDLHNDRERRKT